MTTSRLYMLAILLASSALHALAAAVIVPLTSAADICYGSGFVCLSGATLTPGAPTITQGDGSGVPVTDQTSTSPISLSGFSTTLGPVSGAGGHGVTIFNRPSLGSTGTFNLEINFLDLTGQGFLIRESPTRQSLGQTQVTDISNGDFRIDSFFDIFTELSVDGGQSWIPDNNSTAGAHFESASFVSQVPEPASFLLLSGACLTLLARRRFR